MTETSAAALAALRKLATAEICNAIESARLRLRNEGYMDARVTPYVTPREPMLGYAITLAMRTDKPPAGGLHYTDRSDWWDMFAAPPFPKVVVIADVGETPRVGAVAGETHMRIFHALGAHGLVTDGAVRDIRGLARHGLPVFAAGAVPSHGYAHIVSVGEPVTVGGLAVETGDLLHGDADGIVKIPPRLVPDIPGLAADLAREEAALAALLDTPGAASDFSTARLRTMLAAWAAARTKSTREA